MSIFDEDKIDCHCHVFDPRRFPYGSDNFYAPEGQELGTPDQFGQVLDAYGVGHALLVGPNSGYGLDNSCLLDTLARSQGRLKGVAVVANDASLEELSLLKGQGIVGVAFNPALSGVPKAGEIVPLLEKLARLDLFAQIQVRNQQLPEMLPSLLASGVRLLVDHCGRPDISAEIEQPGFQALVALGRAGRAVVKLSGMGKFSQLPFPHQDTWTYLRALTDAFGFDACVWGSDWPFLRAGERVDYGPLLKLVEQLFPHREDRRKLLWETPRRLFGFDGAS
jgi:predicted TIM-barrel fold metal-dependent hydrolase